MDDNIANILNGVLSDPGSMDIIKNLASGLLDGNSGGTQKDIPADIVYADYEDVTDTPPLEFAAGDDLGSESTSGSENIFDNIDLGKIMQFLPLLSSSGKSSEAQLLSALKPHLKKHRHSRVDQAINIMGIIKILPLLSQDN